MCSLLHFCYEFFYNWARSLQQALYVHPVLYGMLVSPDVLSPLPPDDDAILHLEYISNNFSKLVGGDHV